MSIRIRGFAFAACLVVASPVLAAETLPARAPGLWETKSTSEDGATAAKHCVGEGADAAGASVMRSFRPSLMPAILVMPARQRGHNDFPEPERYAEVVDARLRRA